MKTKTKTRRYRSKKRTRRRTYKRRGGNHEGDIQSGRILDYMMDPSPYH